MTNFIIAGVSGAGKSFLEKILQEKHGFESLVKYSNRPLRPGEEKLVSMSDEEFDSMYEDFMSVIEQTGYKYGYKKSDIEYKDKKTFAVPLKDLSPHIESVEVKLVPIVLLTKLDNLSLLDSRMRERENFDSLSDKLKTQIETKIAERLELAKKDIASINNYEKYIEKQEGKVFYIENDNTLFDEVLPFIESKI